MRYSISPKDMYALEQSVFAGGVSQEAVMEKAALAVAVTIEKVLGNLHGKRILFVCGQGNNGADGLAAARLLLKTGAKIDVFVSGDSKSSLHKKQLERLQGLPVRFFETLPDCASYDALVDALFGIGFHGCVDEKTEAIISRINTQAKLVFSVDVPSGMDAGSAYFAFPHVKADHTISFAYAKDGLLFAGKDRCGEIIVHEIEELNAFAHAKTKRIFSDKKELFALLPKKKAHFHKGMNGRAGLFVGSPGMAGAAVLAGKACAKSGVGLLSFLAPEGIENILQISVPHATLKDMDELEHMDAIGAGCGLGMERWEELSELIARKKDALILDADALHMLAKRPVFLGKGCAITPHILEAARLLSWTKEQVLQHPFSACEELYQKYGAMVLLKNNASIVYDGENFAINALSAPALAKGGSGDILLGLLTGLCAQMGLHFETLCCASLWLSSAGCLAEEKEGVYSATALDTLDMLGQASRQMYMF